MGVQLKKVKNGLDFKVFGMDFFPYMDKTVLTDEEICQLCARSKVKYWGAMVLVSKHYAIYMAEYKKKIYELKTVVMEADQINIYFCDFTGKITDVEPLNEYKYCVQYTTKQKYGFWYYKENEWMKAQEKQRELNQKGYDALLIEI